MSEVWLSVELHELRPMYDSMNRSEPERRRARLGTLTPCISGIQHVLQSLQTTPSAILDVMFPDADRVKPGLTRGTRKCLRKSSPSSSSSLSSLRELSSATSLSSICDVVRSMPSRLTKSVSRSRFILVLEMSGQVLVPSDLDLESKPPLVAIRWRPKLIFFSGTSWRWVSSSLTTAGS
jgi:hypothetical protein